MAGIAGGARGGGGSEQKRESGRAIHRKLKSAEKSQVRGDLMTRVTQVYTKTVLFLYLEPRNLQ